MKIIYTLQTAVLYGYPSLITEYVFRRMPLNRIRVVRIAKCIHLVRGRIDER